MKRVITLLSAAMLIANAFAQAPEKMSYQAVVRDAGNALVTSQAVGMQLSILQGSVSGTAVYVETQNPTTNINGLVSIEIGSGTVVSGTFNTIDWSAGPYFIKTETDPTGGTAYTITGTSQMMSVPYALYAKTAENATNDMVDDADADSTNELQDWSNLPGIPAGLADGVDNVDDADADSTNELQNWSNLPGIPAGLADGVDNVDDADADSTNELQSLSLSNDTLYLSGGNNVYLGSSSGIMVGSNPGEMLYWDGSNWVALDTGITGQTLHYCYDVPTWGPCLAQVITSPIINITGFEATSGGNVTNDGGSSVVARGVCWDINPSPDLTDNFTSDGTGTGPFNSNMLGLTPLTTYHVRAYATNSGGTTYGNELTFVSGADIPVVSTLNVNSIYFDSCVVDAEVLSNGGATVTERGVCYSTSPNPTISDNIVLNGSGLGPYSCNLTGLTGATLYYVRAYATNSTGTAYGNELTFNTLTIPGVSCNSCGAAGNNLTSPLMVGGHIEANVGQSISMTQGKCSASSYLSCAASSFINPPEATVHSYSCTNGTGSGITQVISFDTPGVYIVTGMAGNATLKICTVYIIVS